MDFSRWRSEWGELLVVSLVSFFLYQMNMIMLFCIPLQILFIRKGERYLFYGCAAVMAALAVAGTVLIAGADESAYRNGTLISQIVLPVLFLTGLVGANLRWNDRFRTLYKAVSYTHLTLPTN